MELTTPPTCSKYFYQTNTIMYERYKGYKQQITTQQKELKNTKNLLESSNKLVCQVSHHVQEISEQMTMVNTTTTSLVQIINTITGFMNTHNYTLDSPQTGRYLL
mmetsp:Transcript_9082/g.20073  ORF Transcript_9082/g.20073 Transcript_9082/m.20073 type:complete len:105 (-) Transcript_9082:167-481(-)